MRENKEKATLVHSTTAIWLSCSSFVPSCLDFSAGHPTTYPAFPQPYDGCRCTPHCTVSDYLCLRVCRAVCVINNRSARLPASAHFPAMAAAPEVRRSGGCRLCRRVRRVVVTRRRLQDSGIHDGSRFIKLFLVFNLWWVGWGLFPLVAGIAGICSSDMTNKSKLPGLLRTYCLLSMVILTTLSIFFLFIKTSKPFTGFY